MILEKLHMYRLFDNTFKGKAEFKGSAGSIDLNLNDEQCHKVLSVLGDALVETAKSSAQMLTVEVINSVETKVINDD